MNPDAIKRAVRANRRDRAAGDAPSIGRVSRMPGTGLPKGPRRKRRKSQRSRRGRLRKRIIKTWSVLLSAVALVVLGLTVSLWAVRQMNSRGDLAGDLAGQLAQDAEDSARIASKFPSPSQQEALALVKHALALRDSRRVAEYFLPGAASPQQIVEFLKSLDATDGAIAQYAWLSSMDPNGLSIDGVLVGFAGKEDGQPRNRLAMLTPCDAGKWKIDFEAFASTLLPPFFPTSGPATSSFNGLHPKSKFLASIRPDGGAS